MGEAEKSVEGRRFNPEGYIYGVLAIATVIAAESTRRESFPSLVAASAVTLALYWVAHGYAVYWGSRLEKEGTDWSISEILLAFLHETPILAGAVVPIAVLVLCWAFGADIETAVTAALWVSGAELVILELAVGIRRRFGFRDMAVQTVIGASLGLGILVLRTILH